MSREPDVNVTITQNEGMVVIGFSKKVDEISMRSEMARQIAEEIARKANNATMNLQPNANVLLEQTRGKLITRLTHVIRGQTDAGKLPGYIAQQCVDIIYSEVF